MSKKRDIMIITAISLFAVYVYFGPERRERRVKRSVAPFEKRVQELIEKNSASSLSEVSEEHGIFPNEAKLIADFYRGYFIDGEFNAGIISHWHSKGNEYMHFYWPYPPELGETEERLLVKVHEVTGEALSPGFPTVSLNELQSKFEQVSSLNSEKPEASLH